MALGVSFRDVAYLVARDFASVVSLSLTHQFAFERLLSLWHLCSWNQDKYLKLLKTLNLFSSTSYPEFSIRGREGFSPGRVIASICDGFQGSISYGREEFVDGSH